jgi:hypothetical protein
MTETLRGPLLTAQREISALDIRRRVILQKVSNTEQEEKGAYINATNWQETLQNTAKKAGYVSHHAKLKTELGMVDVQIKDFKQVFGLEMFAVLMELEDKEGWLPTVRDIRSIYDQARRDVEKIQLRQKEKEMELIKLGGTPIIESTGTGTDPSSTTFQPSPDDPTKNGTSSTYFKQIAAAEAQQQQMTVNGGVNVSQPPPATIHSTGGPLSYSIPAVPSHTSTNTSNSVPQQQLPYSDPFAIPVAPSTSSSITTTSSAYPQQQQQQQLPPLSLSSSIPATVPITNPMFAYDATTAVASSSSTLPHQQHPQQMYNSTISNSNHIDPFAPITMNNNNNLFGSIPQQQQQQQQQPMGGDPFGASQSFLQQPQQQQAQPSTMYHDDNDPFAILASPQLQQQQQYNSFSGSTTSTATKGTNENPLFRY